MKTYANGTSKYLVSDKEEIKCNSKMLQKMINFDDVVKAETK